MDFSTFLEQVCKSPGMWVQSPYVPGVHAILHGFDIARDGAPLAGLREWLIVQTNRGHNLAWTGLAEMILNPENKELAQLSREEEKTYLRGLLSLLQAFLQHRETQGLTVIHHAYACWLLQQSWYEGPLRPKARRTARRKKPLKAAGS